MCQPGTERVSFGALGINFHSGKASDARDICFLTERLKNAKRIEPEYRHLGTTTDIYLEQSGFLFSSAVFIELKRNFISKAQLDRLVGQIESLEPRKNFIVVILCGETNPVLVARLKEKYKCEEGNYAVISNVRVIVNCSFPVLSNQSKRGEIPALRSMEEFMSC